MIMYLALYPITDIISIVDFVKAGLEKAKKENYAFINKSFNLNEINKDWDFINIPCVNARVHESIIWSKD